MPSDLHPFGGELGWVAGDPDHKGKGLGRALMERILAYAGDRGIGEIWGDVLSENDAMRGLAVALGFTVEHVPDEPSILRVRKPLGRADQTV